MPIPDAQKAALKTAQDEIGKLKAAEGERAKVAERERQAKFDRLADLAIAGGYPEGKRGALVKFASVDFEAARSTVEHHLPKSAPEALFERMTVNGAPIGKGRESREESGIAPPRSVSAMGRNFVEVDGAFADKIKQFAESKDPILMDKIDRLLTPAERPQMYRRLLAAEKVVRAEYPALAASADA